MGANPNVRPRSNTTPRKKSYTCHLRMNENTGYTHRFWLEVLGFIVSENQETLAQETGIWVCQSTMQDLCTIHHAISNLYQRVRRTATGDCTETVLLVVEVKAFQWNVRPRWGRNFWKSVRCCVQLVFSSVCVFSNWWFIVSFSWIPCRWL